MSKKLLISILILLLVGVELSGCTFGKKETKEIHYVSADQFTKLKTSLAEKASSVLLTKKLAGYKFDYVQKDATQNINLVLTAGNSHYSIGQIGYNPSEHEGDYTIDQVEALKRTLFKVTGYCGANCAITYYLDLSTKQVLKIEANTVESDVDNDGQTEVISSTGTATLTSILKVKNNIIQAANLNKILEKDSVTFDKAHNTFQAQDLGGKQTEWKIEKEKLVKN